MRVTLWAECILTGVANMQINNVDLHVADSGDGAVAVVFAHGLLFSGAMFDPQVAALNRRYRCVAYDHRGQGRSAVPKTGYDMDTLTNDAIGLIEALDIGPCHFIGQSMGGIVGLRLAIQRPDLLRSLTVIGASADAETTQSLSRYRKLNFIARWLGLKAAAGRVMPILFGQTFLNDPARIKERNFWCRQIAAGDRIGTTRAVAGLVNRNSVSDQLKTIKIPTLIITGEEDAAVMPERTKRIHRHITGSKLVHIAHAGNSLPLETPDAVNTAINQFLETIDS